MYAVVDFETTGLVSKPRHRIAEIRFLALSSAEVAAGRRTPEER